MQGKRTETSMMTHIYFSTKIIKKSLNCIWVIVQNKNVLHVADGQRYTIVQSSEEWRLNSNTFIWKFPFDDRYTYTCNQINPIISIPTLLPDIYLCHSLSESRNVPTMFLNLLRLQYNYLSKYWQHTTLLKYVYKRRF